MITNSTTVRAFGEWFVVTADSVDQRRHVEKRCCQFMLYHRETTPADAQALVSIAARTWLETDQ